MPVHRALDRERRVEQAVERRRHGQLVGAAFARVYVLCACVHVCVRAMFPATLLLPGGCERCQPADRSGAPWYACRDGSHIYGVPEEMQAEAKATAAAQAAQPAQ